MTDEQTNEADTQGEEINKPIKNNKTPTESLDKEYEKLKEKNNKIQEELIRGEKLKTESLISGRSRIDKTEELSEKENKKIKAKNYFKGTQLEKDIDKYNE